MTNAKSISILFCFFLTACTHSEKASDKNTKGLVNSKTESGSKNASETNQHGNNSKTCDLKLFVNNPGVTRLAKDIFTGKDWNLEKDAEALALLDSLNAHNKALRPFYFKVVTLSYAKSDGYYSEGLGEEGRNFVEKNTKEFAGYFDKKECFNEKDLETWADIILLDLEISIEERDYGKPVIDNFIKPLKINSKNFSPEQQATLEKFGDILKKKWGAFL